MLEFASFTPIYAGFDSRNHLVQADEITYRYDAENQRIGVNQTRYVINSQLALSQVLVKEENGVKTFYVYGLGLLGEEKEGEYRSYHFDFRGSTVTLTDQTGKVVERFQYGPYGELLKGEAAVTPFLFNGKYGVMTDGNGLYYMRARFYSPEMKRFVNQDVLLGNLSEGQTLNRYAFVTGQPVSLVDPFGLVAQGVMVIWFEEVGKWLLSSPVPLPQVKAVGAICLGVGIVGSIYYLSQSNQNQWVAPGEGINWPGDCNEDYLNYLQARKDQVCKGFACTKHDSCPELVAKFETGLACQSARTRIMNECFRGGDRNHRKEVEKAIVSTEYCAWRIIKTCPSDTQLPFQ